MCFRSPHATQHDDNNQCSQNIRHAFTDWWKWPFILRVWQAHQQSLHLLLLVAGQDFSLHVWHLCAQVAFRGQLSLLLFLGPFTLWPGLVSCLAWFVLGLSHWIIYTFDLDQAWIRFMSSSFQTHHLSAMMLITNGRSFASQVYHYISVHNDVRWHTIECQPCFLLQSRAKWGSHPSLDTQLNVNTVFHAQPKTFNQCKWPQCFSLPLFMRLSRWSILSILKDHTHTDMQHTCTP